MLVPGAVCAAAGASGATRRAAAIMVAATDVDNCSSVFRFMGFLQICFFELCLDEARTTQSRVNVLRAIASDGARDGTRGTCGEISSFTLYSFPNGCRCTLVMRVTALITQYSRTPCAA